ncbi:sigma-70 family RNA polymerase sigma factor [Rhizobium sp. MHM7A]|uniref:RNA polymerase sigma factor n=1 Tax=Rhizobium sp. MHM7A TaxID=2583233 RepID=UPI001105D0D8|nr:sigma-70 family RNA polymerase sigma factor [Rhizobium sp. MHM7A]TLX17060.1 sigma-70 family RNA polymerase sigma factor [Rhizobium sp. MHM7A]
MSPNDAFREQLLNCREDLERFALARTRNPELAQEIVTDTVIEALKNSNKFELGTKMNPWLFTIMVNVHKNMKRRKKVADDYVNRMTAVHPRTYSEADALDHMRIRTVGEAIETLPVEQKSAFYLAIEGYSYEEIGKVLDCGVGAVKSRVMRARQAVAEALDADPVGRPKFAKEM